MPKILAIIVNWNKKDYLRNLLASLRVLEGTPFDIVVVDNASTDGSAAMVRSEYPECALVETGDNLGGTGGFNAGMAFGLKHPKGYEFFWLMDNDIVVKPGALEALLSTMATDAKLAVVGSAILVLGEEDQVQEIGARVDWVRCWMPKNGEGPFAAVPKPHVFECDYASACSCLARVEAIREVGIWDPGYFVQMDDIDWCARLKRAGWRIAATTESRVCHERFDDRRATQGAALSYLIARNWLYLFRKNAPRDLMPSSLRRLIRQFLAIADNAEHAGLEGEAFAYRLAIEHFLEGRRGKPPQELFAKKPPAMAGPERPGSGALRRIALLAFNNPALTAEMGRMLQRTFPEAAVETLLPDPHPYMERAEFPGKRIKTLRTLGDRLRLGVELALRYDAVAAARHSPNLVFKELAPLQIRIGPDLSWTASPRRPGRLLKRALNRLTIPVRASRLARRALERPLPEPDYFPFRT